jgi:peptide/nickel transport system permease protein
VSVLAPSRLPGTTTGRSGSATAHFRRHLPAVFGCALLLGFTVVAIAGPVFEPYSTAAQVGPVFASPSLAHPVGLNDGGIDMLSLLIAGTRTSMVVGAVATLVAVGVGAVVGIIAGYAGGLLDGLLMRTTDYFIIIPALPLMIVVAELWGPSLSHAILVIAVLLWAPTARVLRAEVLSVRERGYVRRARAFGAAHRRIIWRHILPQVRGLIIANAVLTVASAIFYEAALAFLGLESATSVSWGTLIQDAFSRGAISNGAWWAIVPPGLCIGMVVLSCSLVSLAVEDAQVRDVPLHISRHRLQVRSEP